MAWVGLWDASTGNVRCAARHGAGVEADVLGIEVDANELSPQHPLVRHIAGATASAIGARSCARDQAESSEWLAASSAAARRDTSSLVSQLTRGQQYQSPHRVACG